MKYHVYQILNIVNNKCYVGSSTNYSKRKSRHIAGLKSGRHHSIKLQRAWDKYGGDNFRFIVLEFSDFINKEKMLERAVIH